MGTSQPTSRAGHIQTAHLFSKSSNIAGERETDGAKSQRKRKPSLARPGRKQLDTQPVSTEGPLKAAGPITKTKHKHMSLPLPFCHAPYSDLVSQASQRTSIKTHLIKPLKWPHCKRINILPQPGSVGGRTRWQVGIEKVKGNEGESATLIIKTHLIIQIFYLFKECKHKHNANLSGF